MTDTSAISLGSDDIEAWLRRAIAGVLGLTERDINVHKPIATYGVDSAEAAGLIGDLEGWAGRKVPLDLVWEWASTREIAQRLADHFAEAGVELPVAAAG